MKDDKRIEFQIRRKNEMKFKSKKSKSGKPNHTQLANKIFHFFFDEINIRKKMIDDHY